MLSSSILYTTGTKIMTQPEKVLFITVKDLKSPTSGILLASCVHVCVCACAHLSVCPLISLQM